MRTMTFSVAASGTSGISDQPVPPGERLVSLELPALTSTTITITLSTDGSTYNTPYDVAGNDISVVGGAANTGGRIVEIPDYLARLTEGKYVKLTVAAQASLRSITGVASELDGAGSTNSSGAGWPISSAAVDGSSTITLGGTAQNLFAGATPANGFEVVNPDATEDLWISDSGTAIANGVGNIRVAANGGSYVTPDGMRPFHAVSIVAATTGHKFTARSW